MTERRCDGCAFWSRNDPPSDFDIAHGFVEDHSSSGTCTRYPNETEKHSFDGCGEFWPTAVPLPEPWAAASERTDHPALLALLRECERIGFTINDGCDDDVSLRCGLAGGDLTEGWESDPTTREIHAIGLAARQAILGEKVKTP